MIRDTVDHIFDFLSETNLVEEYFYEHKGVYPVYSGQTENDGIVAYIDSYNQEKPCITFTTYGSAGKLSHRKGKFSIGRNCMGLRTKKEFDAQLDMEWFSYKYQNLFYRLRIGDPKGQRSLNKTLLENVSVEIPDKTFQKRQLKLYKKIRELSDKLTFISGKLGALLSTNMIGIKTIYQAEIQKVLVIEGGNSGLTEEFIYSNLPKTEKEKIKIYSGATQRNNLMGFVSRNAILGNKSLKIFNAPCILVTRKGLAGYMTYIPDGEFTTNDDAYVIAIKEGQEKKINLRWFVYQYQELFFNLVTSRADNATFSKDSVERRKINFPKIDVQNTVERRLKRMDYLLEEIGESKNLVDDLIEHEIK